MTFEQALAALQAEFGALSDATTVDNTRTICSGGEQLRAIDPEPALFVDADRAVASWCEAVRQLLRDRKPSAWKIVDGPHRDRFHITVMDERRMQRVAEDRYSVSAKIGLIGPPPSSA